MLVDAHAPVFSTGAELLCHYAEVRRRLNTPKPPAIPKVIIPPAVPTPPAACNVIEWRRVLAAVGALRQSTAQDQGISKVEIIKRYVCEICNVTRIDIESSRRTASVVKPRQIAMALCRRLTTDSLPAIGRRFGDRDHTTVLHAIRKCRPLIDAIDRDLSPGADVVEWVAAARARTEAKHA